MGKDCTRVAVIIPAKGFSRRVPFKNRRFLHGLELVRRAIRKAQEAFPQADIYVDTECDTIKDIARQEESFVIDRPPMDKLEDGHELFNRAVSTVDADIYVQLLCTAPFIQIDSLRTLVEESTRTGHAALFIDKEEYRWNKEGPEYNIESIPCSNTLPPQHVETMGAYAVTQEAALFSRKRIVPECTRVLVTALEAMDIDTSADWAMAESILAYEDTILLRSIEHKLRASGSSLFSDSVRDVIGQYYTLSFLLKAEHPFVGRASTLHVGYTGDSIYDALKSYETVCSGSVICVQNDTPDAYFGDLNANIAFSRGSTGYVTNGSLRDVKEVSRFIPWASNGVTPKDVKHSGKCISYGKPILMEGVPICPGDVIVSDADGTVVIPHKRLKEVLKAVEDVMTTESSIKKDIYSGAAEDSYTIYKKYGGF